MKFVDARRAARARAMEHKMQPGVRSDQTSGPPLAPTPGAPTLPEVRPDIAAEAERLGVDLKTVTGTGQGGRILLRDVRAAASDLS
jgi:pyruvate/2-oxoglutarate dehydrogenase complex dihydrolipoamide acyltransferase (E2) component